MIDPTRFFVTGGTLALDAPSYVERQADTALYEGLSRSEFCYVLTPRQMGKSSLMVRTAARLRDSGVTVAILDLTMVGQLLTQEQWYYGLLQALGGQLRLREPLKRFWLDNPLLGPLQRWMAALREVVVPSLDSGSPHPLTPPHSHPPTPRLVIFVDEIDAVRSLPFSTDELFAAIRECYNRRPHDPAMHCLTFCLVGVATPSDLIQDPRTTPFNIGVRVELEDFTETEAAPLTAGLVVGRAESFGRSPDEARQILRRILYWTSGHPYLTQRLCQAMVDTPTERGVAGVDRVCGELFLAPGARERDDNLILVRERILRAQGDLGGILELYSRVRRGQRVKDNTLQPSVVTLRLSGIVKGGARGLQVRNRIYARAFDRDWIRDVMPGGEIRRQRAAYRLGMLRAAVVLGAMLVALFASQFALQQFRKSQEQGRVLRLNRYGVDIGLAEKAVRSGDPVRARALLNAYLPRRGQDDLRGFEWHYLQSLAARNHIRIDFKLTALNRVRFLDNHSVLASGGFYATKTLDARTGAVLAEFPGPAELQKRARANPRLFGSDPEFTADGQWSTRSYDLMVKDPRGRGDYTVEVARVDAEQGARITGFHGYMGGSPTLSPDGSLLALCRREARVPVKKSVVLELWNVRARRLISSVPLPELRGWSPRFSPDGRNLALATDGGIVRLWRITPTGLSASTAVLAGHFPRATSHLFSPDSKVLAVGTGSELGTGEEPGLVMLWSVAHRRLIGTLVGHTAAVSELAFSPDGQFLVSAGRDFSVKIWDLESRAEVDGMEGLSKRPWAIAVSPDSKRLAVIEIPARFHFFDLPHTEGLFVRKPDQRFIRKISFLNGASRTWRQRTHKNADLLHRYDLLAEVGGQNHSQYWTIAPAAHRTATADTKHIRIQDLVDGETRAFPLPIRLSTSPLFLPEGDRLLSGDMHGSVYSVDARTGTRSEVLRCRGYISALATNGSDVTAAISQEGQLVVRLAGNAPQVLRDSGAAPPLAISPDGQRVAFNVEEAIVVRSLATGGETVIPGLGSTVSADRALVAICPDNRTIAISSPRARKVNLCSLRTGAVLATIRPLPSKISSLDFSPDGSRLAIGCANGGVVLVPPGS